MVLFQCIIYTAKGGSRFYSMDETLLYDNSNKSDNKLSSTILWCLSKMVQTFECVDGTLVHVQLLSKAVVFTFVVLIIRCNRWCLWQGLAMPGQSLSVNWDTKFYWFFFVRSIPHIWMFWCCACYSLHGSIWSDHGSPPGLSRMDGSHGSLVYSWCHHVCDQDSREVLSWEMWHLGEYVSFIGFVPSYMNSPQVSHQAGASLCLCACSMKWLVVFQLLPGWGASPSQGYHLPPALNSPVPITTPGWREAL